MDLIAKTLRKMKAIVYIPTIFKLEKKNQFHVSIYHAELRKSRKFRKKKIRIPNFTKNHICGYFFVKVV